jgi:hypothetical protein
MRSYAASITEEIGMRWKRRLALGLAALLGSSVAVQAQAPAGIPVPIPGPVMVTQATLPPQEAVTPEPTTQAPEPGAAGAGGFEGRTTGEGASAPAAAAYGPTPLQNVGILQGLLGEDCKIKINGWLDMDYTFRSTSPGVNNIAPVMNRFGDEFLVRQVGLYLRKPLDEKNWDWGFNAIFLTGSDATFLTPLGGGWKNTNPRFGSDFTDLNLTAHLDILTEGGVDVKAGRQTTVYGPMGALAWQRYFDSSDYAWYNLEEGRYTGVSANWKITKQLSWYNGAEIGGWGVFFDNPVHGVDYITQLNYWVDEEAKKTLLTFLVLTGPTGHFDHGHNTTGVEFTIHENWNERLYQIASFQMVYSKAPILQIPPPDYQERAYDVYTILGYHCSKTIDLNSRFEWYDDVDGGNYPGGFGIPHTNYFETTLGVDYHPAKWVQFRPEIRYDHASHNAFGSKEDKQDQLSIATELLLKF